MKCNAGIGGWTGHTCHSEPLISVTSQKPNTGNARNKPTIRQSNHWKRPLYFAFCGSSFQSLGFRVYMHKRASEILYSDTSFCGLCHVTIWPARIGICHWRFWFTLPYQNPDFGTRHSPAGRLSGSRISLVSRLSYSHLNFLTKIETVKKHETENMKIYLLDKLVNKPNEWMRVCFEVITK